MSEAIGLQQMHQLTAPTASYEQKADPLAILRSGLVEEAAEFAFEASTDKPVDVFELEGELGDVEWYISEISRFCQVSATEVTGGLTLDRFQASSPAISKPIITKEGQVIELAAHPEAVLAVAALRVADVMNPKHDDLWLPDSQRLPLGGTLQDLLAATGRIASQHDISLQAALLHTVDKLNNRSRRPHVIDAAKKDRLVASRRERLGAVHPFIWKLIAKSALDAE